MNKQTLRFSGLMAAYYGISVIIFAYFPVYLLSFGYSDFLIGLTVMWMMISAFIMNLLVGYLVDKHNCFRQLIMFIVFLVALCLPLLFVFYQKPLLVISYAVIVGGFASLPFGLFDSWIAKVQVVDYGKARAMASISYALFSLALGQIIDLWGNFTVVYILMGISVVLLLGLKKVENPVIKTEDKKLNITAAIKYLKNSPYFWLVLSTSFLTSLGMTATSTYLPLLISSIQGTSGVVGIALFIMAISEVVVLMLFSKIEKRYPVFWLLLVGYLGFFLQYLLWAMAVNPLQIGLICFLQCFSFALVIPSQISLMSNKLDHTYLAFAFLVNQAVNSIAAIIANPTFGWISENYGVNYVFVISCLPLVLALLIALVIKRKITEQETS